MSLDVIFKNDNNKPNFVSQDRLLLGEGLFETIKILNGKPCYAKLHWQRLCFSAKFLSLPFTLTLKDWLAHLNDYIKSINLDQGGIKAVLSGGSAPRGLGARGNMPYLYLEAFHYEPNASPLILTKAPWLRDSKNPIYQVKSINYLEAIMAYRYAQEKGAHDALFFNLDGCALETTIANVFLIINDELITPPLTCSIVPGITRSRILKHCQKLKKACFEERITLSMLAKADALFTCNTLQAIRPVKLLDEIAYDENHLLIMALKHALN